MASHRCSAITLHDQGTSQQPRISQAAMSGCGDRLSMPWVNFLPWIVCLDKIRLAVLWYVKASTFQAFRHSYSDTPRSWSAVHVASRNMTAVERRFIHLLGKCGSFDGVSLECNSICTLFSSVLLLRTTLSVGFI